MYKIVRFTLIVAFECCALRSQVIVSNLDHRPLVGALDTLEKTVGVPVNYEDVPYENAVDLVDVSTPQQRAANPGYHLLVPREGQVSATVSLAADCATNVNSLLASYRQNLLPGDFAVEQANGMVYVVANRVLGSNGLIRSVASPMKTLVTVPFAERTVEATVAIVLSAVSATGAKIEFGAFPFRPTDRISFGATQSPARDVLASVFAKATSTPLSYRLLFDPLSGYMLNVQMAHAGSTAVAASPAPQQPANNPLTPPGLTKKQ